MNKCNLIKRGILLIFLGILLVSLVQAQESKSPIFSFSKSYPDYVRFLPEGKIDSVFYHAHSSIIPVIFKVNKYDLFPNKQLDSIVEVLSRVQKDASVRIAYLWIGGSASPEGPSKWNHKLGEYRSQALAKYLSKETGFPKDLMRVENLWEDWYSFELALKNGAKIPNKEKVLDIWGKRKTMNGESRRLSLSTRAIHGIELFAIYSLRSAMHVWLSYAMNGLNVFR